MRRSEPRPGTACTGWTSSSRSGFELRHDLEPEFEPGAGARVAAGALDRGVRLVGGYSGDFARVLASLGELNRSDVVFSTVDTVGIPLALLGRLGRVKAPVVYAAIGLPERLDQLRGRDRAHGSSPPRSVGSIRSSRTAGARWRSCARGSASDGPRVEFVAFGVDTEHFRPEAAVQPEDDVVSIGGDPRRDYQLLAELARRLPERSFASSRRPTTLRRSTRCRRTSTSRSTFRSRGFVNACSVRGSSRSPFSTTRIRVRPRPCSRGWHAESPWSSPAQRRSRVATTSTTA